MNSPNLTAGQVASVQSDLQRVQSLLAEARNRNDHLRLLAADAELTRLCNFVAQVIGIPDNAEQAQVEQDEFEALLSRLLEAYGSVTVLHRRYQGKAMSDEVYTGFTNVRDVVIPELRDRLLSAFSETEVPGLRVVPVSRSEARDALHRLMACEGRRQVLEADGKVPDDQVAVHSGLAHETIPRLRQQLLDAATVHRLAR